MSEYEGEARPLPYPLTNPLVSHRTTEADPEDIGSAFVWPEDSDERVPIIFNLSLNEFVVLASTIDVGSDPAYGIDAIRVWWLWDRVLRSPMQICELIIGCINSDAETKAAFRDFFLNDPAIQQNIEDIAQNKVLSLTNRGKNILKPDECDPSYIFNQSSVMVQLLHDLSEDMFEAIEVGTNQLERADILVGAVPAAGLNDTAATVFRLADQLAEELQEEYMGAYDEALFDTIRCAVFCACRDDCEMSIVKVMAIYAGLLNEEIPDDPIEALVYIMQFLVTGDIPSDLVVYGMHFLMLSAIQAGTDLLGVDFGKLANRILAAGDDADNDWEVLCEDCNEPEPPGPGCESFLLDEGNWAVKDSTGTWIETEGYKSKFEFGFRNLYIHRTSWTEGMIIKVIVKFTTPVTNIYAAYDNGVAARAYTGTPTTSVEISADTVVGWTDMDSINGLFIICQDSAGMTDATRLFEVCLYFAE